MNHSNTRSKHTPNALGNSVVYPMLKLLNT